MMPASSLSLAGRRALVTGGSRGIGAACCELLAEAGASVCVGYRSRRDEADALVSRLRAMGVQATSASADLGDAAGAQRLFDVALDAFGSLDIVVHSAGVWPAEDVPVHEMSDTRWRRTLRENLDAMFFVSRIAGRTVSDGGRIVHVASTAGQRGEAGHADYAVSKGGMIAFVKSQALELVRRGVTVNCVAPGWVDTEMCADAFADGGRDRISKTIPRGRVASPVEVATMVLALCLPGASHVVGAVVNVNGGSVV